MALKLPLLYIDRVALITVYRHQSTIVSRSIQTTLYNADKYKFIFYNSSRMALKLPPLYNTDKYQLCSIYIQLCLRGRE